MSHLRRLYAKLQDGATAAASKGAFMVGAQAQNHAVYVRWGTGTTSGVVEVETAPSTDYTGDWSALTTLAWSAGGRVDCWRGVGAIGAVRTRVSTAIAGGAGATAGITSEYFGN